MNDESSGAWAPDPWGRHPRRWHTGAHWTSHVTDGHSVLADPPGQRREHRTLPPPPPQARPVDPRFGVGSNIRSAVGPDVMVSVGVDRQPSLDPATNRVSTRQRSMRWSLVAGVVVMPVVGLILHDARDRSRVGDLVPAARVESTATTSPSSTSPENTTTTSTTISTTPQATLDPQLVDDCVAFVPFGAYIGDPQMVQLWTAAGMDVAALTERCERIDLVDLLDIARRRAAGEAFMNGGTAPAAALMPTSPSATRVVPPNRPQPDPDLAA